MLPHYHHYHHYPTTLTTPLPHYHQQRYPATTTIAIDECLRVCDELSEEDRMSIEDWVEVTLGGEPL